MLQTRVRRVILYVADMERQVAFYRDVLGLPLSGAPRDDLVDAFWVCFDTGECTLSLHGGGTRDFGQDAPKLCFFAADPAVARESLMHRGVRVSDLREPEAGVQVFDGGTPKGTASPSSPRGEGQYRARIGTISVCSSPPVT